MEIKQKNISENTGTQKDSFGSKNFKPIFEKNHLGSKDFELTFDRNFKRLFTRKEFLAPILLNIVPEYRHCSLKQIEGYITPSGDEIINPKVYDSEDSGKGDEMTARYDVLIDCRLPDNQGECSVNFFFDLEMQRENTPAYPVVKRGVYYSCRLISRQIETLGEESYNQLKPVYSVWIIKNNIPDRFENSIYTAGMHGSFHDSRCDASTLNKQADLIHLSLVYLSKDLKIEEEQEDLIKYLKSVFNKKVDDPHFNPYAEYSSVIRKEVDEYMSIADMFRAEGETEGEARGKIQILLEIGKTQAEVIDYLTTDKKPLTEEQAWEALNNYLAENG